MNKQFIITILGILGLLMHSGLWADEAEEAAPPTSIAELEVAISKVLEKHQVPAVGIALVDEHGPVWVTALGKANLATGTDADTRSMFRIGSTSKMFVALSVLKLVEQGRLSLDDKITDLIPEIEFDNEWESTDPIRVVHLLEHTTGWDDIHLAEYAHNDPTPVSLKDGLDFHPHSRVSRWKPGSRMSYCNAGPPVAAYILEKITGQSFEDYVQQNFFAPMGMDTMTYRLTADVEQQGVTLYANADTPEEYWHIIMRPSGSINASSADMQKMVSFFVNRGVVNGQRLISLASLERMERVESTPAAAAGQAAGYGLNNYTSVYKNWIYRSHNGGVNGGLTDFSYLPKEKRGYAFMMNSGNGAAFGEISDLIRGFQTHDLETPAVAGGTEISAEGRALAGYYSPTNSRQQVSYFLDRVLGVQRIWFEENKLIRKNLLGGETSAYLAFSPTLYQSEETGMTSLSQVDDPLLGPVIHAGTLVLKPQSQWLVFGQLGVAILWSVSIVLSILFLLIWGVRRLRGKIPSGPTIQIRVWPLLAGLSVVLFTWMFMLGISDPFISLGAPTFISVSIMIATLAFAVFAIVSVYKVVIYRNAEINRGTYWFSAIASVLHLIVALYLLSFGVIGLMTWA